MNLVDLFCVGGSICVDEPEPIRIGGIKDDEDDEKRWKGGYGWILFRS